MGKHVLTSADPGERLTGETSVDFSVLMRMAAGGGGRKLHACSRVAPRSLEDPGPADDLQKVRRTTMNQTVSRSMLSRLLSVATVLTLVGFAASVDLQPESALAAPGASADLSAGMISLADDDNRNGDEHRNENRDRNDHRNHGDNRNHDNDHRNHDNGDNGD